MNTRSGFAKAMRAIIARDICLSLALAAAVTTLATVMERI
jgi:hypothetical protein